MLFEPKSFESKDRGSSKSFMRNPKNLFKPLMPDFSDQSAPVDDADNEYAMSDGTPIDFFEPRFSRPILQPVVGSPNGAILLSQQMQCPSVVPLPQTALPETSFSVIAKTEPNPMASEKQDPPKDLSAPVPGKHDIPDLKMVSAASSFTNDDFESDLDHYEKQLSSKEKKNSFSSSDEEPTDAPGSSSLISRAKQSQQFPSIPQLPVETVPATSEAKYLNAANTQSYPGNPLRGAIAQASLQNRTDWRGAVSAAADQLRSQIETSTNGRSLANEAKLRMMYLLLDDCDSAAMPFSSCNQRELNSYWSNQMLAFSTLTDEKTTYNDAASRFSQVAFRSGEGVRELKRLSPMKLKNVQFALDWNGFGQYMPMPVAECQAGESIGLYMEIDNPIPNRASIMGASTGYHVSVILNYQIRDASNTIVHEVGDNPVDDMSLSLKTDHSILLKVEIPEGIPRGNYKFRVRAADANRDSLQFVSEELPLRIL